MRLEGGGLEALRGEVRVNLRGREARVAEELLHAPEVGPTLEELCGEGVAHGVRRERRVEPGLGNEALEAPA